jgi:hypothetical protein
MSHRLRIPVPPKLVAIPAVVSLALVAALAGPAAAAGMSSGWTIQPTPNPAGASNTVLSDVSCPSLVSCMAVGSYVDSSGVTEPLAEHWNGTLWTIQHVSIPAGGGALSGLSCSSASSCMAVGTSAGAMLAERWNGTAWSPTPGPAGSGALSGVSCSTASACTAVGDATVGWNGTTWTLEPSPPLAPLLAPLGVSCTDAGNCIGVGSRDTHVCSPWRCWWGVIVAAAAQWNGTAWSALPAVAATGYLDSISCPSAAACTAVGSANGNPRGTLVEQWDGSAWTSQSSWNPPGVLSGVSCSTATQCTAVGSAGSGALAEGLSGGTWSVEPVPIPAGATSSVLSAVSCPAANACTAVGYSVSASGSEVTVAESNAG